MTDMMYPVAAIVVITAVTWGLRAFPFLLFGSRPLPKTVHYLGKVLPPAIMTILVVYCLRGTDLTHFPFGIPELIACVLVVTLQVIRNNMYLSIVAGTLCYMILLRIF